MNKQFDNPWVYFPNPNPAAKLRLFCFHYAGGGGHVFHSWLKYIPSNVEMGIIQLPGRGRRMDEPPIKRLLPLSAIIAKELVPYLNKPFVFFGHSLGALLCFEITRNLRRDNLNQPKHLFISSAKAPHQQNDREILHDLPKSLLIEKLAEYNGTPSEVLSNDELLNLLLPVIRADFELFETYEFQPESPLECHMVAYGGEEDCSIDQEGLAAWSEMSTGSFLLRMFPGGHFYINSSQSTFLQTFAKDLLKLCL